MANEITVLTGTGENTYQLLFLFPVDTPAQVGGANVVPTPATGLSETAQVALSQAEKDALDAGDAGFRTVSFEKDSSLTTQQLIARVREIYAAQQADFEEWYAQRYQHVGVRLDATA